MNKHFYILAFTLFFAEIGYSQNTIALVKGKLNHEKATQAILFKVQEGAMVEWSTTTLNGDKSFGFALPDATEGFYYLSDQSKRVYYRVYLKPNDELVLNIENSGTIYLKKASAENKVSAEWHNQSYSYMRLGNLATKGNETFKDFFPKLDTMIGKIAYFSKTVKTSNKSFNELMKLAVQNDLELTAMSFLMLPNSIHPNREEIPAWYKTMLTAPKYANSRYLELGETKRVLSLYPSMYYQHMLSAEQTKEFYANLKGKIRGIDLVANDTLKGNMVVNSLAAYKSFEDMETAVAPYNQYILTDLQKAEYFKQVARVAELKKGNASYNFSYEDPTGNLVKMSDLKGKVVLVDVWATWCGPCKVEIPHLKELEKAMHGKDVAIVSVSVDEEKDKQKWKDFIVKEELGGLQLYAKGWSEIAKYYQITGIPRFMLFDKEGKIITVNAPRPSSPELKTIIEEYLKTSSRP